MPSSHSGRLQFGDCDAGRDGRYSDVYRVTLTAETVVNVTQEADGFNPFLRLLDDDGDLVAEGSSYRSYYWRSTAYIRQTLQPGSYQLVATSRLSGTTGDYDLMLSTAGGTCPEQYILDIELPSSYSGALESGDCDTHRAGYDAAQYADVYRFTLTAETVVNVTQEADGFNPFLRLLDDDGDLVAEGSSYRSYYWRSTAYIRQTLQPGSYQLVATSRLSGTTGDYDLMLSTAGGACPEQYILDIELPSSYSGALESGDCDTHRAGYDAAQYADVYRFRLSVPTAMNVAVESDEFNPYLRLLDGAGELVAEGSSYRSYYWRSTAYIRQTFQPGSYQLVATSRLSGTTGDYRLEITSEAACDVNDVAAPSSHSGSLSGGDCRDPHANHRVDYYRFNLSAPAAVTVDLFTSDFDPYLRLFDGSGNQIGWDDGWTGSLSQIKRILRPGSYLVAATAAQLHSRPSHSYLLRISTVSGSVTQRDALVALYHAAGGAEWKNNEGWLSDDPLGEWHGVTTDASGNVTALRLPDNGLSGAIAPELGDLFNLRTLNLRGNQLSGEIPATLGDLADLAIVLLYDNELSGAIPPELGKLSKLQGLNLRNNRLEGAVPPVLAGLTKLTSLALSGNQLCVPPLLHDAPLLRSLPYCDTEARSALHGLYWHTDGPTWTNSEGWLSEAPVGDWYGVTTDESGFVIGLDLHNNNLNGPIPSDLHRYLPNLQWLRIEGNTLTSCIPTSLAQQILYGEAAPTQNESTFLQGTGQKMMTTAFTTLLGVLGGENQSKVLGGIMSLEEGLLRTQQYSTLKTLGVPICPAAAPEPIYPLATQSSDTDREILIAVRDDFIERCETSMTAAGGESCIERGGFQSWYADDDWRNWHGVEITDGRVTRLGLDRRELQGEIPEILGSLSELEYLNLSHNQLSGPIPAQLGNLAKLRTLALNDNRLTGTIPPELGNLKLLRELYLQHNLLTGRIPLELSTPSYLNLRKMDLDREADHAVGGCLPPNPSFVKTEFLAGLADTVATTAATWSIGTVQLVAKGAFVAANTVRVSAGAGKYAEGVGKLANAVVSVGNAAKSLNAAKPVTAKFVENFSVAITENALGAFAGPVGDGFTLNIDISEKIAEPISRIADYFGFHLGSEIDMDKVYCTD